MEGVPVPIHADDLKAFAAHGLSTTKIADNIAIVLGSDTQFRYADKYLQFLNRLFDDKLVEVFASKAGEALKIGDYRKGLAYLRAGMLFRQDSQTAMFAYASGCRYWYLQLEGSEEDQELIKILKSEAHEYFEHCTDAYPEFAKAWYFLGYDYVNQGQYQRAQIAWRHYLEAVEKMPQTPEDPENIKEIQDRIAELEDPIRIEKAVTLLNAGQTIDALRILEPYSQTGYSKWWPLHMYLAQAYRELGYNTEAIEGYQKVLQLSGSTLQQVCNSRTDCAFPQVRGHEVGGR
jgi:tetratricopeptide (TPR) repeat protein